MSGIRRQLGGYRRAWLESGPSAEPAGAHTSDVHRLGSPSGLNTMSRRLTPSCGAASPTPLDAYMIENISFVSFFSWHIIHMPLRKMRRLQTGHPFE